MRARLAVAVLVLAALLGAACARSDASASVERAVEPTTTTSTSTTTSTTAAVAPLPAPGSVLERIVVDTRFGAYATIDDVVLVHPAAEVERVGFHEASHDGARRQDPTRTVARSMTLQSRHRGTEPRSAADIVVAPDTPIRAPVTGTVLRGGVYALYCDHVDEYVVVEPDARPGWEVKILHFEGLRVAAGQRVEAGVTPIADRSRVLPFESQVDEFTAEPSWPHVHVEVVDTSIPDEPDPGGGPGC